MRSRSSDRYLLTSFLVARQKVNMVDVAPGKDGPAKPPSHSPPPTYRSTCACTSKLHPATAHDTFTDVDPHSSLKLLWASKKLRPTRICLVPVAIGFRLSYMQGRKKLALRHKKASSCLSVLRSRRSESEYLTPLHPKFSAARPQTLQSPPSRMP